MICGFALSLQAISVISSSRNGFSQCDAFSINNKYKFNRISERRENASKSRFIVVFYLFGEVYRLPKCKNELSRCSDEASVRTFPSNHIKLT